jgi:hypothetical protein
MSAGRWWEGLLFFLTTIGPAQQFNEIILLQNSPVQALPTPDEEPP